MSWLYWAVALVSTVDAPLVTLDTAMAEAAKLQPSVEVSRQRGAQARARYIQARSLEFPQLNFSAQLLEASNNATSTDFIAVDDLPRIAGVATSTGLPTQAHPSYRPRTNSLIGLGMHYQLLDFGYTRGRVDSAKAEVHAAGLFGQQALQDAFMRVSEAYLRLVAAEQFCIIAQDMLQRAQKHHDLAEAGTKSGLRPKIDVLRSDAELAAAQLRVIRADIDVRVCRSSLDTAIGWDPHPYRIAVPPAPSNMPQEEQVLMQRALSNRPDLAGYRSVQIAATNRLKAAFALNLPQIIATGSTSFRGVDEAPRAFNWDIGLMLSFPLFNGFLIQGQNDEAVGILGEASASVQLLRDAISYQLIRARDTLISAASAVSASRVQVVSATATLDQAETRYEEGLGDIVELTDAQTQLYLAREALIQCELSQSLSSAQLKYVCGELAP